MTVLMVGNELVCSECGGTCPWDADNYDDIMHHSGCTHKATIDLWENHPALHRALMSNKCENSGVSCNIRTSNPFGGCCPAKHKLSSVLPKEVWTPHCTPICCDKELIELCYKRFYSHFEDEVLSIVLP